ncbi:MAG: DinB family protein [Bryobacteraceae bacterium]
MPISSRVVCSLAVALAVGPFVMRAQDAPQTGFRADFLRQLTDVQKKFTSLAEAMPQDKYGWRPGEGVRSVSEVYTHIAGANYFLLSFAGVKPPAGLERNMEKTVTQKAKVVEEINKSFEYVRHAVLNMSDADLEKPAKLFGRGTNVEEVYFVMANHMHEHLGQSIAYARTNGVVPPWSAKP